MHAVSPKTQVGLMNSGEPAHSVQGATWMRCSAPFPGAGYAFPARGRSIQRRAAHRRRGNAYGTSEHGRCHSSTFWASEVENYPNTPYTKKRCRHAAADAAHALAGADGLTLNLHDYLATPLPLQREYAEMVCKSAPAVEAVQQLRRGKTMRGVGLPWRGTRRCTAKTVRTPRRHAARPAAGRGASAAGRSLYSSRPPPPTFCWATTCCAIRKRSWKPSCAERTDGGQHRRRTPVRHGLRTAAGLRAGRPHRGALRGTDLLPEYARQWAGTLLCTDWEAVRREGAWITRFAAAAGAQEICRLLDEEKQYLAPALIRFENALGGIVCVLAAPVRTLGWLCRGRAALLRGLLRGMPGCAELPLWKGTRTSPLYYEDAQGGGLLGLVNCGLDDARAVLPDGLRLEKCIDGTDAEPLRLSPVSVKFTGRVLSSAGTRRICHEALPIWAQPQPRAGLRLSATETAAARRGGWAAGTSARAPRRWWTTRCCWTSPATPGCTRCGRGWTLRRALAARHPFSHRPLFTPPSLSTAADAIPTA